MNAKMGNLVSIALLCATFCGCGQRSNDTQALLIRPLPANGVEVVAENYGQADPSSLELPTFEFNSITVDQWQEAYGKFGMALVEGAKKHRLDSESLSNCLMAVLTSPESKGYALLPVAAVSATLNQQKVWMIDLKWETPATYLSNQPMGHVRTHWFTQNGTKQVNFSTCR